MSRARSNQLRKQRNHLRVDAFWRQEGRCHWCKVHMMLNGPSTHPQFATVEHLKPVHAGGEDTYENCVAACHRCNQKRGASLEAPQTAMN